MNTNKRRRNNLIAVAVLLAITAVCLLISRNPVKDAPALSVTYKTLERNDGQKATRKIVLDTKASQDEIKDLIRKEAEGISAADAFIYVYNPGTDIRTGFEWTAMFTRENGIDKPVNFK